MKNQEIIKLLKSIGYERTAVNTDRRNAKTYYLYRRGLHINATENLSFHIEPPNQDIGLGRFGTCATKDGKGYSIGTNHEQLFFPRLLSYLRGERNEKSIIDEIVQE